MGSVTALNKIFNLWLADILFRWAYKLLAKHNPPVEVKWDPTIQTYKPKQQEQRTLH